MKSLKSGENIYRKERIIMNPWVVKIFRGIGWSVLFVLRMVLERVLGVLVWLAIIGYLIFKLPVDSPKPSQTTVSQAAQIRGSQVPGAGGGSSFTRTVYPVPVRSNRSSGLQEQLETGRTSVRSWRSTVQAIVRDLRGYFT